MVSQYVCLVEIQLKVERLFVQTMTVSLIFCNSMSNNIQPLEERSHLVACIIFL